MSERTGPNLPLHPEHFADLRRSGVGEETIAVAGIRSLGPAEQRRYLSPRIAEKIQHCYIIPYPDSEGFYRVKLFPPIPDGDGQHIRYYQPAGTAPRLYFPPRARASLADPTVELVLTEGEKKALKADQEGLACAALGGLWSWLLNGAPLPDLDRVDWCERRVLLAPDSDVWTRPDLLKAVYALGRELEARGASTVVVKLPAGPSGSKVGLDDYLCVQAIADLERLPTLGLKHPVFLKANDWWKTWSKRKAGAGSVSGQENGDQGRPILLSDLAPWPDPVYGAELFAEIERVLQRFIVLPEGAAPAVALWVVHAHAHEASDVSPFLALTSPVRRCGKTRLIEIVSALVPRVLLASNISPAALFRAVEKYRPTLLIDEAETFVVLSDELKGLLNAGHTRQTACAIRTVGDEHKARAFSTWCPKALALIGKLPETLEDRAIVIRMRRRAPGETVERWRERRLAELRPLARRAARWVADHLDELRAADPTVPEELDDRAADNWRPLLAIADLAGGHWPAKAREAARRLSAGEQRADSSLGVQLLADLRVIFTDRFTDRMPSAVLCDALANLPDRPWGEYGKRGKPISQRQVSLLLAPFGITPKTIRVGDSTPRGYELAQFDDTFSRYLPADPQHLQHPNGSEPLRCDTHPQQPLSVAVQKSSPIPHQYELVADVADQGPGAPKPCYACHRSRFWRSRFGGIVCGTCHPPTDPALVAGWLGMEPEER